MSRTITLPAVPQAAVPDLGASERAIARQVRDLTKREQELRRDTEELQAGLVVKRAELEEAHARVRTLTAQEADAQAAQATGRSSSVKDLAGVQTALGMAREHEAARARALSILEERAQALAAEHDAVETERAALHARERAHAIAAQIDAIGRPMIEAWKTLVEGFIALAPLDREAAELGVPGVNPDFLRADSTLTTARTGGYHNPRPAIFVIRATEARPLRASEIQQRNERADGGVQ